MRCIHNMRNEEVFSKIWKDQVKDAKELGVDEPKAPRSVKRPRKYEDSDSLDPDYTFTSPEEYFRKIYYEILDSTITALNDRFENETMDLLRKFENFLVDEEDVSVKLITEFYNIHGENHFTEKNLKTERDLLIYSMKNDENFKTASEKKEISKKHRNSKIKESAEKKFLKEIENKMERFHLKDVIDYFKIKPALRESLPQLSKFVEVLMTIPATSCSNERAFSLLRRLKNYLRSVMLEDRLNNLAILSIYKEWVDQIPIDDVLNTFLSKCNLRMQTFALVEYK